MRVRIEASDQEFLDQLHRLGQATVSQICEAVGVTATAVRQRLTRLQSLELVSRTTVKADRGRPHHVYQVTESGLRQLGDNYRDLAMILWREIKNIEEQTVRDAVLGPLPALTQLS